MFTEKLLVPILWVALNIADSYRGLSLECHVGDTTPAPPLLCLPLLFVEITAGYRLQQPALFVKKPDGGSGVKENKIDLLQQDVQDGIEVQGRSNGLVDPTQRSEEHTSN